MILNEAHLIYFSPTQTSKKIAEAFARGTGIKQVIITDLTTHSVDAIALPASSLAIIVVPVYGGHVAPLAMKRLQNIQGTNTPAVLVVVYGNRAYDKALKDLDLFASSHGFKVVAGATFIGEHSFSTDKHSIAAGRPDSDDLAFAGKWAETVMEKLRTVDSPNKLRAINVSSIRKPNQPLFPLLRFIRRALKLQRSRVAVPRTPWVPQESKCTHCGLCVQRCPTGAIAKGDELHTDAEKCIRCCACVKVCAQGARVYETPFAAVLADCFKKQKAPQAIV